MPPPINPHTSPQLLQYSYYNHPPSIAYLQSTLATGAALNPAALVDFDEISVGNLVNILKVAIKDGKYKKYQTLDQTSEFKVSHIEPGRLDVRVQTFYNQIQVVKGESSLPIERGSKRSFSANEDSADFNVRKGLGL